VGHGTYYVRILLYVQTLYGVLLYPPADAVSAIMSQGERTRAAATAVHSVAT